jgi:DMSO reductase anchor subunit
MHLGRPRFAFRAFLGLRTSWLSREIIGFSIFAGVAALYALSHWRRELQPLAPLLEASTVLSGLGAVGCSVMVYVATGREGWRAAVTVSRFTLSMAVLGCATVIATAMLAGAAPWVLCPALAAASLLKLASELAVFRHLRRRRHTAHKRTAMLMAGDLGRVTTARVLVGAAAGVALPLILWLERADPPGRGATLILGVAMLAGVAAGELLERYLFFTAAAARKMPGGPA